MDGRTDDRCWPQSKDDLFIRQVTRPLQVIMSETEEKCARNSIRMAEYKRRPSHRWYDISKTDHTSTGRAVVPPG